MRRARRGVGNGGSGDRRVVLTPKTGALCIGKLAVAQAARGRGSARAMIALAERRARELGLGQLELQTRVGVAYWTLTAVALGFQIAMIGLVLYLNRRHFGRVRTTAAIAAE